MYKSKLKDLDWAMAFYKFRYSIYIDFEAKQRQSPFVNTNLIDIFNRVNNTVLLQKVEFAASELDI
jgi:hypothetical protein